jgi:hypothetical protein
MDEGRGGKHTTEKKTPQEERRKKFAFVLQNVASD